MIFQLYPKSRNQSTHVVLNSFSWERKEIVRISEQQNTEVTSSQTKRPKMDPNGVFLQQTLKEGSEISK